MDLEALPLLFPVWLLYIFSAAAVGVALLALASGAAAVARRWRHTERLGFLSTIAAIAVVCSAMIAIMIAHALREADTGPREAALALGRSVAALVESTGPALPAAVVGALTWWLARRQGRHRPGRSDRPSGPPEETPSSRPRH